VKLCAGGFSKTLKTMSKRYCQEIADLQKYFAEQIANLPAIEITAEQRQTGIDGLPEVYRKLNQFAFHKWLEEKNYELSYNQACNAMFAALEAKSLTDEQ
jgi:uncharacterized phage infection (PIP) family protein YhgE